MVSFEYFTLERTENGPSPLPAASGLPAHAAMFLIDGEFASYLRGICDTYFGNDDGECSSSEVAELMADEEFESEVFEKPLRFDLIEVDSVVSNATALSVSVDGLEGLVEDTSPIEFQETYDLVLWPAEDHSTHRLQFNTTL